MDNTEKLLRRHISIYPGMELEDCVKLLYQNEFGMEHLIEETQLFKQYLTEELNSQELADEPMRQYVDIGDGLCRFHLSYLLQKNHLDTFTRICIESSREKRGNMQKFIDKLMFLRSMCEKAQLPYDAAYANSFLAAFISGGCPPISHSGRFKKLYKPHYRVILNEWAMFMPLFMVIDNLLLQMPNVLICIDGMAGAGKTSLAHKISTIYNCPVIHADDFFLRPQQRTQKRLIEPGGNIDYERLMPVAQNMGKGSEFSYEAYSCELQEMGQTRTVPQSKLNIFEGAYSLHPKIAAACNLKIFLYTDSKTQKLRITKRNPDLAGRFMQEWIPMENEYFRAFKIRESCDFIIDTSQALF